MAISASCQIKIEIGQSHLTDGYVKLILATSDFTDWKFTDIIVAKKLFEGERPDVNISKLRVALIQKLEQAAEEDLEELDSLHRSSLRECLLQEDVPRIEAILLTVIKHPIIECSSFGTQVKASQLAASPNPVF